MSDTSTLYQVNKKFGNTEVFKEEIFNLRHISETVSSTFKILTDKYFKLTTGL